MTFAKQTFLLKKTVIRYLNKKGLASKDVHCDIVATWRHGTPSYATVNSLMSGFMRGSQSLEDDVNTGKPVAIATLQMTY